MYGVGGSNLAIGISLIMRGNFAAQANQAGVAMDSLEAKAQRLQRQQISMQRDMNATGAVIGLAAIRGMGQWYREGAKFGYTMKYVSSLAGGGYDELSKKATRLGEATIFTAKQVADGMRWMAQSGMQKGEILSSVTSIANLATATLSDIGGRGGAADWVTNISKAFKIPLNEQNVSRVSDVIAASVNKANLTLYDYGEAMKYAQSTAKTLGVTLEETSAAIMVMGNAGMQGSMAGTAFENSIRYISRAISPTATGRQTKALLNLGLSPKDFMDSQGNLINYGKIIEKIGAATKKLKGNVAAQGAIVDIFGVRGARNASLLINSLGDYNKLLGEINNSKGYSQKISDNMMDTPEGSILQLISTWESFKIKFMEAIAPMINPLIKGLRWVVSLFSKILSTNTGQNLAMIGAAFITIRTAVMSYRAIVLTLKLAHGVLGTSAASATSMATAGYNTATVAANRYATAAGRAGMMGGAGGIFGMGASSGGPVGKFGSAAGAWLAGKGIGSYTKTTRGGQPYTMRNGRSTFVPRGTATGWSAGASMGKFGKFAGNASPYAMLGGIALGMGSEAAGADTGLGKGLGIAGDTLGMAGTGAMLGSIIPGIGTAVGAVIGGVGGLLFSLHNRLGKTADDIESQRAKMESKDLWQLTPDGNIIPTPGKDSVRFTTSQFDSDQQYREPGALIAQFMKSIGQTDKGDIIINIDGERTFSDKIKRMQAKNLYNIGI